MNKNITHKLSCVCVSLKCCSAGAGLDTFSESIENILPCKTKQNKKNWRKSKTSDMNADRTEFQTVFHLLQAAGCNKERQWLRCFVVAGENPGKKWHDRCPVEQTQVLRFDVRIVLQPYSDARRTMEPTEYNWPGTSGGRLFRWYVTFFTWDSIQELIQSNRGDTVTLQQRRWHVEMEVDIYPCCPELRFVMGKILV